MPNRIPLPPQNYLLDCFYYDPYTGILRWKSRPREHFKTQHAWLSWNTRYAGRPGSVCPDGYVRMGIGHRLHLAHRIISKLVTGHDPPLDIDHRDRNPTNNRWLNLKS
jgi:hypothetical protein